MHLNEGYGQPGKPGSQRGLKSGRTPSVTELSRSAVPALRSGIAGIMGGINVDDSRNAPARRASLLDQQQQKSCSLTTSRVVTAVYTATLIVVLLITHLHMTFAVRDWQMQQRTFQLRRYELEMQSETVTRLNNQYLDLERLQIYATERLRMKPVENAQTLIVSDAARRKYQVQPSEIVEKPVNLALDQNNAHKNLSLLTEMVWPTAK